MHYYTRHIGDYTKDTFNLTLLEHGVYTRLLDVYYTEEQPIQDTKKYFCIGARSPDEQAAVNIILESYFELEDGFWVHKRCEDEIVTYEKICNRNRKNGKKGGRPKKNPEETQSEPTGNPDETHNKPTLGNGYWVVNKDKCFEEFWSLYPKKVGKKPAKQKWDKLNLSEDDHKDLMKALSRQKRSEMWTKDGGKYIPDPSTWINQERWTDELPEQKQQPAGLEI